MAEKIIQETRLYDPNKNETRAMRSKEEAEDYRYFPDPDLLPVVIDEFFINEARETLPELPQEKFLRLQNEYKLTPYEANILTTNKELALFFENTADLSKTKPKLVANWILGEVSAALNKHNISIAQSPISEKQLAKLLQRIDDKTLSGKTAKNVFEALWNKEGGVDDIIEKHGLKQITDETEIEKIIDNVLASSPQQLSQYRAGKEKLFGYFVGQVMKETQGKANPQQVNQLLKQKL